MKLIFSPRYWAYLLLVLVTGAGCATLAATDSGAWFERDELTIAVTDSGLGGVSVVADLEQRLRETRAFEQVNIVFFNALFSAEGGYNSLPSREEKIRHFDRALAALDRRYRPDLILVACNTLSVLINDTAFARHGQARLRSIVDPGVALIAEALRSDTDGKVLVFATRTTVEEDSHRRALAAMGLDPERVILQACPELAGTIERGCDSEDTELLITTFVDEAAERLATVRGPVFASLCCSHYPYAEELWRAAFADLELGQVRLLNPNQKMVELLFTAPLESRFEETRIEITVVSKVEISEQRRSSISRALLSVSRPTADALRAYEWLPDLF